MMPNLNEKLELIQTWINDVKQNKPEDELGLSASEFTASNLLTLIQRSTEQAATEQSNTEAYADLDKNIQEQTKALTKATSAMKNQINKRETAVQNLRRAYNNLEVHLQGHISYQSRLNKRLQEQIDEQKRIYILEQEERALTEALRETLTTMSSTLDLDKILDHILEAVKRVTSYDGANVLLVESNLVRLARQKGYIEKEKEKKWLDQRIPLAKLAVLQQMMDIGQPMAIPNTVDSPMKIGFPGLDWVNSNVIAPIRSNGKVMGFISLDSATPGFYSQVDADRLQTFANQAAIAIQNARLLDRAKRSAVLAERNRIAGELHDTITQTLWSISLISERMPEIWAIDQVEGQAGLATLRVLAQNALAEMRTLLVELQPTTLTDANLGDLIRQVAEIMANRSGLSITVNIIKEDPMPSEVHFALYRVVQEAINNVVQHALASRVEVELDSTDGEVLLTVQDNGLGFDPEKVGLGHLGLSIMKDRIENIGGNLAVISTRENGTQIKVTWSATAAKTYVKIA